MSRVFVTWMLAALMAPTAGAAPFLMAGVDAGRTGGSADTGPATFDTAFVLPLRGTRAPTSFPLVIDGGVFAIIDGSAANTSPGLYRVDLATGESRVLVPLARDAGRVSGLTSDGARLFLARGNEIAGYDLTGRELWARAWPHLVTGPPAWTRCEEGAVREGTLFVLCAQNGFTTRDLPELPMNASASEHHAFAAALDAMTGEVTWLSDLSARQDHDNVPNGVRLGTSVMDTYEIAVAGDRAYVVLRSIEDSGRPQTALLWALDRESGAVAWSRSTDIPLGNGVETLRDDRKFGTTVSTEAMPSVIATASMAYFKDDRLHALDPKSGDEVWSTGFPRTQPGWGGSALALAGDALFVTAYSTLYRIDARSRTLAWAQELPELQDFEAAWPITVAGGHVFVRSFQNDLYAFDTSDGHIAWKSRFGTSVGNAQGFSFSVGDGVVAVLTRDGALSAIGRTAASITPRAAASNLYPAAGESVTLDLRGTGAGASGPADEYRVDWADGTLTEWQSSPDFQHAFSANGERDVMIQARNAAGQTATVVETFHVGGVAPNAISDAFAPANQERTFFLLGLVITGIVGLIGVLAVRRRRGLLVRELRALDDGFARTQSEPAVCEAMLAERKARAHALLLDGKLDEGQFSVLKGRVEEHARRLRLGRLDRDFGFLPLAMARALEGILADGHVTAWEREHFLRALQQDAQLTPEYKERVRALIEEWFARDAQAPAPHTSARRPSP